MEPPTASLPDPKTRPQPPYTPCLVAGRSAGRGRWLWSLEPLGENSSRGPPSRTPASRSRHLVAVRGLAAAPGPGGPTEAPGDTARHNLLIIFHQAGSF